MAYRRLRLNADVTQLEVEARARLTKGRFWKLENGFENATNEERPALAKAFGCDVADIPTTQETDEAVAS